MVQKSPNLMPAKFEVLIRGPVNSVSYFTVYTVVFEQKAVQRTQLSAEKCALDLKG